MTVAEQLKTFATGLKDLLNKKEEAEQKVKDIEEQIHILMPEFVRFMKDNNMAKSQVIEGIGVAELSIRPKAEIKEINQDKVFNYLKAIGEGGLIKVKESIHHKTLEGYVNGLLKDNKPLPEGIDLFYVEKVKIK